MFKVAAFGVAMEFKAISYKKLLLATLAVVIAVFFFTYLLSVEFGPLSELLQDSAQRFGLPGLFIASIIANATILLPVPIDIIVFLFGEADFYGFGILSPLLMALVVGFGAAIGEMSGYVIGFFGVKSVEKMKREEIKQIVEKEHETIKFGGIVVFLGALTPFPFDLIGIAAGIIKFNFKKFFIACFLGKLLRYMLIAYAGRWSLEFLTAYFGF